MKLAQIIEFLEDYFPLAWAEQWDKVGLVLGDLEWEINKIRLSVDPTVAEAEEAAKTPGTLLVTHHPLLLKGANFLPATTGKGYLVTKLLTSKGALWCAHTNSDRARQGTVGAWIDALRLKNPKPIVRPDDNDARSSAKNELFGLGVIAQLDKTITVKELLTQIKDIVPKTAQGVLATGPAEREVSTVAICPGAGDSLLEVVSEKSVDAYITSDLRHHPALEHLEAHANHQLSPVLIDLPHYASEYLYLPKLAKVLEKEFPDLTVEVSDISSDPFSLRA